MDTHLPVTLSGTHRSGALTTNWLGCLCQLRPVSKDRSQFSKRVSADQRGLSYSTENGPGPNQVSAFFTDSVRFSPNHYQADKWTNFAYMCLKVQFDLEACHPQDPRATSQWHLRKALERFWEHAFVATFKRCALKLSILRSGQICSTILHVQMIFNKFGRILVFQNCKFVYWATPRAFELYMRILWAYVSIPTKFLGRVKHRSAFAARRRIPDLMTPDGSFTPGSLSLLSISLSFLSGGIPI